MDFKVGDVVEVDESHVSNAGFKWAHGKRFTVLSVSDPMGYSLRLTPEGTSLGHPKYNPEWYEKRRFKKVEVPVSETLARSEKAMPIELARQARALMLKAVPAFGQSDVIIRTRSWSYNGEYAAIEVPSEGGGPLYNTADVLDWLKTRQQPVQVRGSKIFGGYWTFVIGVTPRDQAHNYVKNPNGSHYWTQGQLEACNGIVEQDGVIYHLGAEKFVRFGS